MQTVIFMYLMLPYCTSVALSSDSGIMVMIVSAAVLAIKRCLLLQYGPIRSGFMMMRM